ncbi:MAG: hypothetical protein QNK24_03660 [Desulfuromusa sp.]|nr:hypothetical protein [Desulfuromusa sp.]
MLTLAEGIFLQTLTYRTLIDGDYCLNPPSSHFVSEVALHCFVGLEIGLFDRLL